MLFGLRRGDETRRLRAELARAREALRLAPGHAEARNQLGRCLTARAELRTQAQDWAGAEPELTEALRLYEGLEAESPAVSGNRWCRACLHRYLGDVHARLGRGAEGRSELDRAVELFETTDLDAPGTASDWSRWGAEMHNLAMFLARQHTGDSYPDLGRAFGGKHHTTVISAVEKIALRQKNDAALRSELHAIESLLLR